MSTTEKFPAKAGFASVAEVAAMIDHALLHPAMSDDEVAEGCHLARACGVAAACVKPCGVSQASALLADSTVRVCAVAGFPHGNSTPAIKAAEAKAAIADGATEIDMVVNIGKVKSAAWHFVSDELRRVNETVAGAGALLKVILETDFLDEAEIIRLCELGTEARVAFVKTSTGFGFVRQAGGGYDYRGATLRQIDLMRRHSGPDVQVKASGGIRTLDDLLAARDHGATRIGMSATKSVLDEAARRLGLAAPATDAGAARTIDGY